MRPEDIDEVFEQAFSKIKPRDDAHRDKLARLKERLIASNEELRVRLENAKENLRKPSSEFAEVRAISADRARLATETQAAMATLFDEQTALIDRIRKIRRS